MDKATACDGWQSIWVLVCVPATLLLIQLPDDALGKAVLDGPNVWTWPPVWETWMKFLAQNGSQD